MTLYLVTVGHLTVVVAAGLVVIACQRQIARHSPTAGIVVATGIVLRLAAGLSLFFISYLDLPLAAQLHDGDGFWQLAPDARIYYLTAAAAAEHGLSTISSASASPAFTRTLALWMRFVGVLPVSAVLLNLLCYILLCRAIVGVAMTRAVPNSWTLVPIVAFTFSPALLVFGTQALKDTMFMLLVAAYGMSWVVARWPDSGEFGGGARSAAAGLATAGVAMYLIGGIRAYFSVILWTATAIMFVVAASRHGRRRSLRRYIPAGTVTLIVLWLCFMAGAGPYYAQYSPSRLWSSFAAEDRSPFAMVETHREEFVQAGGDTNIWSPSDSRPERLLRGLAAMFIPITVLRALSVVDFNGGRGLLGLTDVDTLFLDVFVCLSLVAVFRMRTNLTGQAASVLFLLALWLMTTLLLAYVVTNFGTLFRLRLMAAVSIWMVPVFCACHARHYQTTRRASQGHVRTRDARRIPQS